MNAMTLGTTILQPGGTAPAAAAASGGTASAASNIFASVLTQTTLMPLVPLPDMTLPQATQQQDAASQISIANLLQAQEQTVNLADIGAAANPEPEVTNLIPVTDAVADEAPTDTVDLYTLTTAFAPVEAPAPAPVEAKPQQPTGLFGSRENDATQPIQDLLARVPANYTQNTQPQTTDQTSAIATQEKVTTLVQSGTALPTLPANTGTNNDNTSKLNPLVALAKKANVSTEALPQTQVVADTDTSNDAAPQLLSKGTSIFGLAANTNTAHQPNDTLSDPTQNVTALPAHAPASASHALSTTPGGGQELSDKPVTLDQLSVRIAQGVHNGDSKINIQLEPASLGKIQVHIDLTGGKANITIVAEKSETLDILKNDSGNLQRTLADAGIKADAGAMQFAQRDGGTFNFGQNEQGNRLYQYTQNNTGASAGEEANVNTQLYRVYESNRALDIFA